MSSKILSSKVADPYATALLNLDSKTNTLDTITSDINDLLELFASNENLVRYLENPLYPKSSKKVVLEKVIKPLSFDKSTVKFLMVLLDRNRIDLLEPIIEKYLQMVYDFADIKIAQVSSAILLTPEQELDLISRLRNRTGATEIKLLTNVDESLLAGLKVQIGSNVIDLSLKAQLKELATQLDTNFF
jgi:F-type H+-transporting ATPase subunit delta